jgi:uncharacterized protein YkwD
MFLRRFSALILCLAVFGLAQPSHANSYRAYADAMLAELPDGVVPRPDLEQYLDSLASAYRREEDRRPLTPQDMLREAARAQALDMMLGGYVGHESRRGDQFHVRFEAFAGDADQYPARGENAARDTQKGEADKAKARRLFQQWIDSGGHRRNLLSRNYDYISTGVMQRGNKIWAVQMFWAEPQPPSGLIIKKPSGTTVRIH